MSEKQSHTGIIASYRIRILVCIIAIEIVTIGFFSLWPVPDQNNQKAREMQFSENVVTLEEVVRTSQNRPASPPKPQTPIPEPTDKIIEEEITNLDELSISDFSDSASVAMLGNKGNSDQPVSNPQTPPSPVRIVELTVPDAAQKANIKAEIWVTFLVDEQGNVEEASISQVKRYNQSSGEVTTVQTIGYGLTEAALDAALQWKFRPARNNGGPVKAYSRQTFSVGF